MHRRKEERKECVCLCIAKFHEVPSGIRTGNSPVLTRRSSVLLLMNSSRSSCLKESDDLTALEMSGSMKTISLKSAVSSASESFLGAGSGLMAVV